MLNVRHQKKYLNKIKNAAKIQLNKNDDPFSPEDVHQFRLALKKLKSLSEFLCSSKEKNCIGVLKKAFSQSGNILDLYNAYLITESHFVFSVLHKNKWQRELNIAYQRFVFHATEYRKSFTNASKHLQKKIRPVSFHCIDKYFKRKLSAIPKYLEKNNDEDMHSGRKQLKNLLYLHHMLPRSIKKKLLVRVEYIDSLQDIIGKWHDLVLAEAILKNRINRAQMIIIRKEKEHVLGETKKLSEDFLKKITILPKS
jgi:CHAD domain-containing protein